jgi:hypothetical protein
MAQVIEGMPSNHKALSSHPSTHIHTPKKKTNQKKNQEDSSHQTMNLPILSLNFLHPEL